MAVAVQKGGGDEVNNNHPQVIPGSPLSKLPREEQDRLIRESRARMILNGKNPRSGLPEGAVHFSTLASVEGEPTEHKILAGEEHEWCAWIVNNLDHPRGPAMHDHVQGSLEIRLGVSEWLWLIEKARSSGMAVSQLASKIIGEYAEASPEELAGLLEA